MENNDLGPTIVTLKAEVDFLGEELTAAKAEIERLRAGGCARDQSTTQYCAEAAKLAAENERLRETNEMMLTDIRRTDVDMLAFKAEIERLRAALESTEAWLERWAVHVGRCEGGHRCTCGLTAVQYEGSAALAYPAPGKEGNTND